MNKYRKFAAAVCVLAVVLAGCGQPGAPDTVEETTIVVDKSGTVTYHLVGDFEKKYYSLSELTSMAVEEAAEFGAAENPGEVRPVTVDKVETIPGNEGRVAVTYRFDGTGSFSEFTGQNLFFGSVNDAVNQGYTAKAVLRSVKDGTLKTGEWLEQDGEKLIIITDARAVIYCPAKAAYVSDGLSIREDGSIDASQAEGTVYILLK